MAYTDHQAPERWDDYRMRQEEFASTSLIGTKTGLAVFDAVARGWEGGELAGIIARPYVGKSWVLCHSAATAYREQKRILFVSPEMSRSEIGLRADQLLFPSWEGNQHHDTLPLQELITGQLPGRTEVTYKAWLESFSRERRWVTVDALSDRGIRVNLIDQLIVSYEPDLVCIDGLMLLDSPYESTWEKAKDIAYTLKNVASHRRIPILFVAQSNRMTRERNDIPSLNEIAYGDAIGQACDRVVGLGMPATGAKTVRLLQCQKFRNGWIDFHRRQAISFSPDVGDVGRIVSDLQQDDVTLDDDPNY
jgi:predicted ATP-dependent serine protease